MTVANSSMTLKNNDCGWEGLTVYLMPHANSFSKVHEGHWVAKAKRGSENLKNYHYSLEKLIFSSMTPHELALKRYMRAPQWLSKTMIIADSDWYFSQCRYAKLVFNSTCEAVNDFRNNHYSWEGSTFSSMSLVFSNVHASPSMSFKTNDYSWASSTFSSMPLSAIVFKSTCEPLNVSQQQWL